MTQRHAPPCPRRTEVGANASGTLRRGRFSASHSQKYGLFGILPLDTAKKGDILIRIGLRNPATSGSLRRHGGDFRTAIRSIALYSWAGLRVPSCESMAGVTCCTFLTPSQVRLLCTGRRKPGKTGNDLTTRRSPVRSLSFHRRSGVVVTLDLAPHRKRKIGPMGLIGLICLAAGAFAALYGGAR